MRRILAMLGAFAIATAPAAARPAAQPDRAAAPVEASSEALGGGSSVVTILGIVAIGLLLFLAIDSTDGPDSP